MIKTKRIAAKLRENGIDATDVKQHAKRHKKIFVFESKLGTGVFLKFFNFDEIQLKKDIEKIKEMGYCFSNGFQINKDFLIYFDC